MNRLLARLLLLLTLLAAAGLPLRAQQLFLRQFGAAEGLSQPFIYALAQDAAGYLWLATAEGVVRYDGTAFQTFTTGEGLAENFATGFWLEPQTGALWVRHFQGGLSRWDGRRFRAVAPGREVPPARPSALSRRAGLPAPDTAALPALRRRFRLRLPAGLVIQTLLTDREGSLWLGTAGQGLYRLTDPHISLSLNPSLSLNAAKLGAPRPLPDSWAGAPARLSPGERARLPAGTQPTAVARAPDGSVWVGTALDGAFCLPAPPAAGRQKAAAGHGAALAYSTANGLLHNTLTDVLADRQGRVWLASPGTGLSVWEKGKFRHFRRLPGAFDALALAEDAAGRIWVGTNGNGLWCFADGRFRQFTTRHGLGSDYCYALAAYPRGDLLVVHQRGLSRFDGRRRTFGPLAAAANPLVRDCRPRAAVVDAAGTAWVETRAGRLRVLPGAAPGAGPPGLAFEKVEVDGAARPPGRIGELAAGAHRLAFSWRGLSLAQAGAVQYQYRLRGYQERWSRPAATGEAEFPRLDAGQYVFEGRARLGPGGTWAAPLQARFGIAVPLWRRPGVVALALLALVAGVGALVRAREAALRQRQRQLEATVRRRTAELQTEKARIEHLNADLTLARDAAEASRLAKSRFLANMSHEIRTPMNAVIGLTYLLQRMPGTAEQGEYLAAIQGSSQNLLTILNDILDSSKMDAGKLTLERVPLGLRALLARVARLFEFAAASKGLSLRVELGEDVPAAIYGDPTRLSQILVNLLGNAIKFTARGHVTLRVEVLPPPPPLAAGAALAAAPTTTSMAVTAAAQPHLRLNPAAARACRLRIAVEDTGIGIAADQLETIFEDFSQANTATTRQFGGTGLGLSIARSLVELHGGRLRVESEPGRGSAFWFELLTEEADAALSPAEGPVELTPFAAPLRVLVAEDNELNQLVARKTLEAWNVHVSLAANGRLAVEAVAAAQAGEAPPFDAVLMDVQMPEMDGYEATRQLRRLFPDPQQLPIIGLTASALPEDRALALAAGMNDTLPKPFDPAVLYAALARHTGRAVAAAADHAPAGAENAPRATPATESAAAVEAGGGAGRPVPDWALLEELALGNEEFISQIISLFLRQAPLLLTQLETAAAAGRLHAPALAAAAHKLRGQAAYFGAPALLADLLALEQPGAADGALVPAAATVADVGRQLRALYPVLRRRLARSPPAVS